MHHCKCFSLFQAVAFLTQPTPVSGVENEGIGPKPVISSTGKDTRRAYIHTNQGFQLWGVFCIGFKA